MDVLRADRQQHVKDFPRQPVRLRQDRVVKLDVQGVVLERNRVSVRAAQARQPVFQPAQGVGQFQIPLGLDAGLAGLQGVRVLGKEPQLLLPHGHAVLISVLKELVGQHPGDGVPCKGDFRLIGPVDDLKLQHLPEHRGQVVQKVSIHR